MIKMKLFEGMNIECSNRRIEITKAQVDNKLGIIKKTGRERDRERQRETERHVRCQGD